MARPRKSLSEQTSHLTKEERALREHQERESKVGRNMIPPGWLNEKSKVIFYDIVSELDEKELLDNLDLPLLSIYCDAYARVQELTNLIDKEGYIIFRMNDKGSVTTSKNPNVDILKLMQKTVLDYAVRLGLNSIDRTKLITTKPKDEEVDPFETFIK